jgi:hypothetical protein
MGNRSSRKSVEPPVTRLDEKPNPKSVEIPPIPESEWIPATDYCTIPDSLHDARMILQCIGPPSTNQRIGPFNGGPGRLG